MCFYRKLGIAIVIKTNLPCMQYKMILEISSKKVCGILVSVQWMLPSATDPFWGRKEDWQVEDGLAPPRGFRLLCSAQVELQRPGLVCM